MNLQRSGLRVLKNRLWIVGISGTLLLDINKIHIIIRGRPTFIGQWPEIDVVIIKAEEGGDYVNPNKLLPPFENEVVRGPILLVRMDENSEPQDFTVNEYESLLRRNERLAA